MSSLRNKWREVSLGEICEFKYGKSLPASKRIAGNYPVYGSNGAVGQHNQALTAGPTVVIGRKGSLGEVHYSHTPCWPIDTTYYVDSSSTGEDLRWLSYRLAALGLKKLNRAAAVPGLNREDAYRKRFLVPPLEEQRMIAEVLVRADELRAKRRQALAHLDDLTQSIFLDMFGDPRTNEHGWARAALHEMVAEFRYGTSTKSAEEGSPALRIPNVAAGALDLTEIKLVPVQPKEFERLRLRDDDLLFVRTNGNPDLVGRCAAFREELVSGSGYPVDEFIYASYLIRARPLPEAVDSLFLQVLMNTPYGRTMLRERCKTSAGQYNINIEGLGSVPVVTPPLELQRQFAERVRTVESAKNEQQAQLAELDALFASLQDRAFRGLL